MPEGERSGRDRARADPDHVTTVFELLSRRRRRLLLYVLRDEGSPTGIETAVDRVLAREAAGGDLLEGNDPGDGGESRDGSESGGGDPRGRSGPLAERHPRGGDDVGRDRVRTALRHVHLPKLAAAGAVEHDPDGGVVRYAADDLLDDWVARAAAAERP